MTAPASAPGPAAPPPRRRRRRRWRTLLLGGVLLFVLVELAVRVVLSLPPWSRPFLAAPRHIFYPELAAAEARPAPGEAATLEVLILGGSTLDPAWSDAAARLQRKLEADFAPVPVSVLCLARAGQTSLDTLYKLRHLHVRRFDVLVVYDGLNDVRFNACPPELFRRDYGQMVWYRALAGFEPSPDEPLASPSLSPFVLPTALRHLLLSLAQKAGWLQAMDPVKLDAAWLGHAAALRTRETYESNLRGVLALARASGTPLVLPAFAWHEPPKDAAARPRDPGEPVGLPVEHWGRRDIVLAGLRAHDAVMRKVARGPGVRIVETAALAAEGERSFVDVCHLTPRGSEVMATLLAEALVPVLAKEK